MATRKNAEGKFELDSAESPRGADLRRRAVDHVNSKAGKALVSFATYERPEDAQPPIEATAKQGEVYARITYPNTTVLREVLATALALGQME